MFRFKFLLLALSVAASGVTAQPAIEEAWSLNRRLQFNEAEKRLRDYDLAEGEEWVRGAMARALTLLSVQPKTSRNVDTAYGLLEEVLSSDSGDDLKAWALYYLARIDQLHRTKPDAEQALRSYRDLIERYPDHIAAQLGFLKSILIRLYANPENRPAAVTLKSLETEARFLQSDFARNQFHTLMADGYLFFEISVESAMEHLLAARALGSFEIIDLGNDYLRIANIAYELGRPEIALSHYRRFLEMRPQSTFAYMIRERIAELGEGRGKRSDGMLEDWSSGVVE
jgi:tetratricopeptide (TPR) repeat protein